MKRKNLFTIALCFVLLTACAPSESAIQTAVAETAAANPTNTCTPIKTTRPTKTTRSTFTPWPTATKTPYKSPTPFPEMITIIGSDGEVIDVDMDAIGGNGVLHAVYNGSRNFIVKNFDENGYQLNLLVNTIGAYDGVVPLDFLDNETTTRIQVETTGEWTFDLIPLTSIRTIIPPATIQGTNDYVFGLLDNKADLAIIDANAGGRFFAVIAWGRYGRKSLIMTLDPYQGEIIIPDETFLIEVRATGPWEMGFSAK